MKISESLPKILVVAALVGGVAIMGSKFLGDSKSEAALVEVTVPQLSDLAQRGKKTFDANCAQCHGSNAAGSDKGPPLVHGIYNPGHHADAAFFLAVKNGVRRHHWKFGDMPPQPKVKERQVPDIVRYVRELQVANGITYEPHRM